MEFIQDASKDKDGLTKEDIAAKMGYIWLLYIYLILYEYTIIYFISILIKITSNQFRISIT